MIMKWINWVGLFSFYLTAINVKAETRSDLFLHAHVRPTIGIKLREERLGNNQSRYLISTQTNLENPREGQKFEVEGLDQKGLESHIDKIISKDHTIQYAILIKRLQSHSKSNKPILLKISAN